MNKRASEIETNEDESAKREVIHMKKADAETNDTDELRPEYRREDFGIMTRGKYAAELRAASNVVVLDADVEAISSRWRRRQPSWKGSDARCAYDDWRRPLPGRLGKGRCHCLPAT